MGTSAPPLLPLIPVTTSPPAAIIYPEIPLPADFYPTLRELATYVPDHLPRTPTQILIDVLHLLRTMAHHPTG